MLKTILFGLGLFFNFMAFATSYIDYDPYWKESSPRAGIISNSFMLIVGLIIMSGAML